jgi:hypothetical protein
MHHGGCAYRKEGVLIQLLFGSNLKACVVAASGPGQVDCHLKIAVHLLVNGPAELCPVVPEKPPKSSSKIQYY